MTHRLHAVVAPDLEAFDSVDALTRTSFDDASLRERRRQLLTYLFGVDVADPDTVFEAAQAC